MKKGKRRWWLIALVVVIVVAAAVAATVLLLNRNKSATVHYLTSTAAKGTIAETVQAAFTLSSAQDAMTISLSGTGSASSSSSGNGSSLTSDPTSGGSGAITTVRATTAGGAVTASPVVTYGVILADDTQSPSPSPSPTSTAPTPALTSFRPTSGPVGTSVTVNGRYLVGVSAVRFNGRSAYFKVLSATTVTAIVPAGARSGPITVTCSAGTAASPRSFTVSATPRSTPTRSSGSGSSFTSSRGSSSGTSSASTTASSSSSSASGSSSAGGVVTGIAFAAGKTPATLQRLLSVSGSPKFAFVSPTPLYATLSVDLASGALRSNVAALQRALKADGYFTGTVNGDFGSSTETALKDWQAAQGLSQTGEITTAQFIWVPKGAVIESWNVVLGGSVSSATALATIGFPSDLIAQALVTQADISSLKVGQKAALTIDGETSDPFTGTITSIANQPASSSSASGSSSTVEYTVDLVPRGMPSLARSGMTGSLTVTIASRSNVLLVPTSAVSGTSSASFVRVMMNGTPTYRQVTTGMATSSLTQITSGLQAGEVVVTGQYTNSATSSASTSSGFGGLGGLGGFSGGGGFRRSTGGSSSSGGGTSRTSGQ